MPFDLYPAVDENLEFPPDVQRANMPLALSTSARDAISAARKWDGRQIYNTTLKRYERWDATAGIWRTIADQQDLSTLLVTSDAPSDLGPAASRGSSSFAARADHVHLTPPPPTWQTYTPAVNGASGGVFPSYTSSGRYFQYGKFIYFSVAFTITNIGTVPTSDGVSFYLPKASAGATCIIAGRGNGIGGWMFQGVINGGTDYAVCFRYDNAGIALNGQSYLFTGGYQTA